MKENDAHPEKASDKSEASIDGTDYAEYFSREEEDIARAAEVGITLLTAPYPINSASVREKYFSVVKKHINPDETPDRYVEWKRRFAITASRANPDRVNIEFPKNRGMIVTCLQIDGHVWYDYDRQRWNIPEEFPPAPRAVAITYAYLLTKPPFHSEEFQQLATEILDAAPGCNLNLGGDRGDIRVAEHGRIARKMFARARDIDDVDIHQVCDDLEYHNSHFNVPKLSEEQMVSVWKWAMEDIRHDK
jgi:hypothetical protein